MIEKPFLFNTSFFVIIQLERNAFIQALSRFTLLMATSQVMEIKAKNVECLKTLIAVAQTDGNYLGEAWYDVSIEQIEANRSTLNYFRF